MLKLYDYFIKFICLFVPGESRRKRRAELLLLPTILKKNKQTKKNLRSFEKEKVSTKSVLIVEPNPYHFELQPGYCKYFRDLGYHVEVIAQPTLEEDSSYIKYENPPKQFYLSTKYQKKALALVKIKDYDFVFLSTSVLWADNVRDSYINWLGFEPNGKYGFMMVEHNIIPYFKDYSHDKYLSRNKIFSLAGQCDIPMLNPHYFGNIRIKPKNEKTTFAAVVNEAKNIDFLFETCKSLINKKIENFQIIVTGRSVIKEIPEDLQNVIKVTGSLKFEELWTIYENVDFILPMLNPEIKNQDRYKKGTVTGSWQIMMGFIKPLIINVIYTDYYKLNKQNSIIYNTNENLTEAIEQAIFLSQENYQIIQNNIKTLSKKIYNESLDNLKKSINLAKN